MPFPKNYSQIPNNFIHRINFSHINEVKSLEDECRILEISDITHFNSNVDSLFKKQQYLDLINNHQHLFIISLAVQDDEVKRFNNDLILWIEQNIKRPIIIEIVFDVFKDNFEEKFVNIWYKDGRDDNLELFKNWTLTEDKLRCLISGILRESSEPKRKKFEFSFGTLLRAIKAKIHADVHPGTSIVEALLDFEKWIFDFMIYEVAAASNSALTLRFLNLFRSAFKLQFDVNLLLKNVDTFDTWLALFDVPMTFKFGPLPVLLDNIDNIIRDCIKLNKRESLRFFLNFLPDVNKNVAGVEKLVDILWEMKPRNPKLLMEFLMANSCYPQNFNHYEVTDQELKDFINKTQEFHQFIIGNAKNLVENFINENPYLKIVNNTENKSACAAALGAKRLDIYVLLRTKKFRFHNIEDIKDYFTYLDENDKIILQKIQRNVFENSKDSHLLIISERSKLGFNHDSRKEDEYFTKIHDSLKYLNSLEFIKPILQIISKSKSLNIIFDFNRDSVDDIDPRKNENVLGTTYLFNGYIYIGAKGLINNRDNQAEKCKVYGVIAHEFAHYALQLTYCNNALPYFANNKERRKIFEKVFTNSERVMEKQKPDKSESIVNNAFNNKATVPFIIRQSELIVRVVHLIAQYSLLNPDWLRMLKSEFKDLFEYYEHFVLPDLNAALSYLDDFAFIREINELSCKISDIKRNGYEIRDETVRDFSDAEILKNNFKAVRFSHINTSFMMSLLYQHAVDTLRQKFDVDYIFIDIDFLRKEKHRKMIQKACKLPVKPTIIIECPRNFQDDQFLFENFDNKLIIIENSMSNKEILKETFVRSLSEQYHQHVCNFHSLNYSEKDLKKGSQKKLRQNRSIKYQGIDFDLDDEDFDGYDFVAMELPKEINHGLQEVIQMGVSKNNGVERNFRVRQQVTSCMGKIDENLRFKHLTLKSLIEESKKQRIMILSGEAGIGKTTSLKAIAKEVQKSCSKTHWITYLDLKFYVDVFENKTNPVNWNDKSENWQKRLIDFFINKILRINNEFEKNFFIRHLRNDSVILFCDGFDEVCPQYIDFVLGMLKAFTDNTKNQLWVTTRSNLVMELEYCLGRTSIELSPISDQDKKVLLSKYLNSKEDRADSNILSSIKSKGSSKFKKSSKIKRLSSNRHENLFKNPQKSTATEQVQKIYDLIHDQSINTPLQIELFAEVYLEELPTSNKTIMLKNSYILYRRFIELLIKRWSTKGECAEAIQRMFLIENGPSVPAMHHYVALKESLKEGIYEILKLPKLRQQQLEYLKQIGIIKADANQRIKFLHDTFAEYYISDFLFSNIFTDFGNIGQQVKAMAVLVEVLVEKRYQLTRKFLNDTLMINNVETLDKSNLLDRQKYIKELITGFDFIHILHVSIEEGHVYILKRISKFIQIDEKFMEKVWMSKDGSGRSVLHAAIACGDKINKNEIFNQNILQIEDKATRIYKNCSTLIAVWDEFVESCQKFKGSDKKWKEKLLKMTDNFGNNCFHIAAYDGLSDIILYLCNLEFFQKNQKLYLKMIESKNKDGFSVLQMAVLLGNVETVRMLLRLILTSEDRKKSIKLDVNLLVLGQNSQNSDSNLQNSGQNQQESEENSQNSNQHNSLQNLQHFRPTPSKSTESGSIPQKSINSDSITHKSSQNPNNSSQNLTSNQQNQDIYTQNTSNILKSSKLTPNPQIPYSNLKTIITSTTNFGRTPLHTAAFDNQTEMIKMLLKFSKENLNPKDFCKLLHYMDKESHTVFHVAAAKGDLRMIEALIDSFDNQNSSSVIFNQMKRGRFLAQHDKIGRNGLIMSLTLNSAEVFDRLFEIYEKNFTEDQIRDFLLMKNKQNESIVQLLVINNKHADIVASFWTKCKRIFGKTERRDLLMSKSSSNENFLHSAAKDHENLEVLKEFWKIADEELSRDDIKRLIESQDKDLNTPIHLACKYSKNQSQLSFFLSIMMRKLNKRTLRSQLQLKNSKGLTPFSALVSQSENLTLVTYFWKFCSKKLRKNEKRELLQQIDNNGNNILQLAAVGNHKGVLEEIWKIITATFDNDIQKSILEYEDAKGRNVMYKALMANCDRDIIETLWKFAKHSNSVDLERFIAAKGHHGYSAISVLSINGTKLKEATQTSYLDIIESTLPKDKQKELLKISIIDKIWLYFKLKVLRINKESL